MRRTPAETLAAVIADKTITTRKGAALRAAPFRRRQDLDPDELARTLQPRHFKVAYALGHNVKRFFAHHPFETCGFLTLTFASDVDARTASKRFKNLKDGILRLHFDAWIGVTERTARGRIHFHLLIATRSDIRSGFDFDSLTAAQQLAAARDYGPAHREATRRYSQSACPALRHIWAMLRQKAPAYGFGRTEFSPLRTNAEAVAHYVGKYIAKHVSQRHSGDERAKTVFCSAEDRRCTTLFAWHSPGATKWRKALAQVSNSLGCRSMDHLRQMFGPRWAFRLGEAVLHASESIQLAV